MEEGRPSVASSESLSVADFRNSINRLRNSINNLPLTDEQNHANNEKRWRLSYLKKQFESLQLNKLFNRYTERINHGYFSQFLSLQMLLSLIHFVLVLVSNISTLDKVIPDLTIYGLLVLLAFVILVITDKYVKFYPKLLKIFAISAFLVLLFVDVFVPFYYKSSEFSNIRPAYCTHLIISCYVFLNVHDNITAIALGLFVSVFNIFTLIVVTYADSDVLWKRLLSDGIYLSCINGLGIYFRYMNEIVKRRSFLDRRSCVESTFQLKFEEEQESHLMSSIIPKHIIDRVKADILNYWNNIERKNEIPRHRPFKNPYVETHDNVSILFADIVNYTNMTTKLNINDLLETLNELFGRFDDASEDLKVLRIKFLGDCYYCVAGLPPDPAPNHAEACVDFGLKMITIIADVRRRRNLDIDMRIGIHSGTIISGIIGSIKWQYDIWSNDVDIANKMETEGCPGKVHLTQHTRQLLQKAYDISPPYKIINNLTTYLISPVVEVYDDKDSRLYQNVSELGYSTENETASRRPTIFKKHNTSGNESRASNSSILSYLQRSSQNGNVPNENAEADVDDNTDSLANYRRDTFYSKRHPFVGPGRRLSGNPALGNMNRRLSMNSRMSGERRITRTDFMNNNIKRYEETLVKTNKELEDTIENMLLSKFEQWFKVDEMNRIFLTFKNLKSELHFIVMPDPLFKYYLFGIIPIITLLFLMENLTQSKWDWSSWPFYLASILVLLIFIPLTWTHHLWTRHVSRSHFDIPKNPIIRFFYNTSKFITNNVVARIIIYTVVCLIFSSSVLTELLECERFSSVKSLPTRSQHTLLGLLLRSTSEEVSEHCIIPWHMTQTCALAIIITFLFLRLYMWLKFFYAVVITTVYSFCIWNFSAGFYKGNETYNPALEPQLSHTMSVVFLTLILHLIDRQTEYMNRLDHSWYETLIEKQKQANSLRLVNNMLLKNILPIHVAELYLDVNRRCSEGLYHENYDKAAVMFASIVDYSTEDMGQSFLTVMNTIICDFDTLSVGNTFGRPIEKIKIAKWTYMAACGLAPGLGNIENIRRDQMNHAVMSLLKFATSLMKKLKAINAESMQDLKLRVGISYGHIVAGVVGSKKPLYDIWGDPVNMASRMDTTGTPNHIQVLKGTAEIIQEFGYVCNYRGDTVVKGKDHPLPTYFVALHDNFDLVRRDDISETNS